MVTDGYQVLAEPVRKNVKTGIFTRIKKKPYAGKYVESYYIFEYKKNSTTKVV